MRATLCAIVFAAGLGAPVASAQEDVGTAAGHAAEDAVVHTAAEERALTQRTSAASAVGAAAAAVTGPPQDVGRWGPVVDWPVVGVHVALMPDGKVLAYDSVGDRATETYTNHTFSRATVWDPPSGSQTPVDVNTGFNIFCSGLAHLMDGRLYVAGGNKDSQLNGIVQTHTFDSATDTWTRGADMAAGRWYPTVTPLDNGEMLITSGRVDTPEVRKLDGSLRSLPGATRGLPLYPWMDVAPNGKTFNSGPDPTMKSLDTDGTGSWDAHGPRDGIDRTYGSHAMYDIGKILVAGGGPSTRDSEVIDINGATPQVSRTDDLATGRRQHNLTVLADGTVLATGGNSSGAALVDVPHSVYTAEQWNPATGAWRTLDAMQVPRQYHSSALLLPDGRVLSSGGGICGTCDDVKYLAKNAEVFSPPYLFQADGSLAPRPVIGGVPATAGYGAPLNIATADAASIAKVALIRLGAVTHSVNMEQRYVPLSFGARAGSLTATGPANADVAPPGVYMLVIVNDAGVPSVARMVTVQQGAPVNVAPTVSLTSPGNGAAFTAPATVGLAATAADSDGSVAKVEFFNGSTKLGEDTTAPYTFSWNGVGAGNYALTTEATDNVGATKTSAAVSITVSSPPNVLPTVGLVPPDDREHFPAPATAATSITVEAPARVPLASVPPGSPPAPANLAPAVTLTSPKSSPKLTARATVRLAASASDADGRVVKVEFFRGSTRLGTDTTAPYTRIWRDPKAGTYKLTARATDDRGATRTAAAVTITVRKRVRIENVAVVESTGARLLRLTTSASTTVRVTLAKRRATSWVELPGKRIAAVRTGRAVVSLHDPWAGRRLTPGKYRVAVRVGSTVVHRSFTLS